MTHFLPPSPVSVTRSTLAIVFAVLGLAFPSSAVGQSESDVVRVRIFDGADAGPVRLSASGGDLQMMLSGRSTVLMRLRPGETARIGVRSGEVYVQRGEDGFYAPAIDVRPASDAQWSVSTPAQGARSYVGLLHVEPDGTSLQMVNAVTLKDYVASVVAAEYGFDDQEGSKAMAVVARTYGLRAAAKFDGSYDHVDNTASQVFRGIGAITPTSRQAARATSGEVLTHEGALIEAVYFSSSGGHTANNEDVWDADEVLPYLRGRRDPYDTASPHHRWTTRISRSKLLSALSREQGTRVTGFVLGDRSNEGRLVNVELLTSGGRTAMQANAFRMLVNRAIPDAELKSTWFDARRRGGTYVFEGRGFGHGVGLSQWGAHEMATRGFSYRDILQFYYDGVSIETVDGTQVSPPSRPVAAQPTPQPKKDAEPRDTTRRIGW